MGEPLVVADLLAPVAPDPPRHAPISLDPTVPPRPGRVRRATRTAMRAAETAGTVTAAVKTARFGFRWGRRLATAGALAGAVIAGTLGVAWLVRRRRSVVAGRDITIRPGTGAQVGEVVDVRSAADILDVGVAQVEAMVNGGMLTPVDVGSSGPRFAVADVEAVRLQGG